jgi:arylsulfatase A-like enzyme
MARYEDRFDAPSRRWLAASITHMDHGVGRIVEALGRRGLRENTLLVFASDNGGQKSWHSKDQYKGRYADKPHTVLGDNRPLRGWKGDVYEGGIRVPALANWPGVLEPGTSDLPMHIVDWMPTLCALAGYTPKRDLAWDGRDLWRWICSGAAPSEACSFYWKTSSHSAVRFGPWKLIAKNRGDDVQLFNLESDPYETQDLAGQEPERVAHLKRLLAHYAANDR